MPDEMIWSWISHITATLFHVALQSSLSASHKCEMGLELDILWGLFEPKSFYKHVHKIYRKLFRKTYFKVLQSQKDAKGSPPLTKAWSSSTGGLAAAVWCLWRRLLRWEKCGNSDTLWWARENAVKINFHRFSSLSSIVSYRKVQKKPGFRYFKAEFHPDRSTEKSLTKVPPAVIFTSHRINSFR